jgi:hypothetical protein
LAKIRIGSFIRAFPRQLNVGRYREIPDFFVRVIRKYGDVPDDLGAL